MKFFLKKIGALTSKPYAFTARPWELKKFNTIDLFDSIGSSIIIDVRNSEIMRITPEVNETLNEEWITDKARFAYDLLAKWRFITPLAKENDVFINISWSQAFEQLKTKLSHSDTLIKVRLSSIVDLDSLALVKKLVAKSKNMMFLFSKKYAVASVIKPIVLKKSTSFLIYNINLRLVSPLLNLKLRKKSINNLANCYYIGPSIVSTVYAKHLGVGSHQLVKLWKNKNLASVGITKDFTVITACNSKALKLTGFANNFLSLSKYHTPVGFSLLNLKSYRPYGHFNETINYHLGQFFDVSLEGYNILQSSYATANTAKGFDLVLPTLNWLEEEQSFVNCFSMLQKSNKVVSGPKGCRSSKGLLNLLLDRKPTDTLTDALLVASKVTVINDQVLRGKLAKRPEALRSYNYHASSNFLKNSTNMVNSSDEFFKGKNDFLTLNN